MWSIGNEISEATDTSGFRIAKALIAQVHQIDPTRAVTEAMTFYGGDMTDKNTLKKQALHMDLLDVVGFNYNYNDYIKNHEKHPNWIMYGSESMPPLFWENWQMVERLPYVIGDFTWAAMDYMGEAGAGIPRLEDAVTKNTNLFAQMNLFYGSKSWPAFNSYQGVIDLIGNRKTASYFQNVVWRKSKVEMFVHRPIPARKKEITSPWGFPDEIKSWTWPIKKGEKMQVHVYTRSSLVRLELNGKVVGQQTMDKNKSMTATFEVPYEEGELTAYCYDNWRETGSERLKTLGKPAAIRLIADRNVIKANKNDLSYITIEITDSNGNVIPNADNVLIKFGITGNGKIAGVGNGNPVDMSSFQQPQKRTYQGKCLVIISPDETPGTITLTAKAEGLKDSSMVIKTE
jgi:beta-galactosidase